MYGIKDDIEERDYDTIGKYYDLSKLINFHLHSPTHENTDKNNIVETELPLLVSEAIENICDEIPLTPEGFLTDIVTWTIDILIDNVKEGCYDFLGKYKTFSKIVKSIQQIREEGSI